MNISHLKPATQHEIKTMTGIIYLIYNRRKDMGYIGQTHKTFYGRYAGGKWWRHSKNPILSKVNLDSSQSYEIYILEHNKTLKELNILESFYIGELKTLYPNGYNFQLGGESKGAVLPSTKEIIGEKNSKKCILYKDGEKIQIKNIKKFCRSKGISASAMYNMISGRSSSCAGYTLNGNIIAESGKRNVFTLEHPEYGEKITTNLRGFARENNIPEGSIHGLTTGYVKSCHGWKIIKEKSDFSTKFNSEKSRKYVEIVLKHKKNGEERSFTCIAEVVKFLNKNKTVVHCFLKGYNTSISEWEVVSTKKSDSSSGKERLRK